MWYEKIQHNSIFDLLSKDSFDFEHLAQFLVEVAADDIIAKHGSSLDYLIIPTTASFNLNVRSDSGKVQQIGSIVSGRSLNLYCYLRQLPLTYTCVVSEPGEILKIPRDYFDEILNKNPLVKNYLIKVTEESYFKNLAKEWMGSGLEKETVFRLIY